MKHLLILALTIVSLSACSHSGHYVHTLKVDDDNKMIRIVDDNKTLSMEVKTRNTGKPVDFEQSFDVAAMTSAEKEQLKTRVLDSLGVTIK